MDLAPAIRHDGNTDLLVAGNSHDLNSETGQYDASIGLFLSGDGKGNFTSVAGRESGFFADGDVKAMAELLKADGSNLILIAQNSDSLKAYSTGENHRVIRLKKDDRKCPPFSRLIVVSPQNPQGPIAKRPGLLSHVQ